MGNCLLQKNQISVHTGQFFILCNWIILTIEAFQKCQYILCLFSPPPSFWEMPRISDLSTPIICDCIATLWWWFVVFGGVVVKTDLCSQPWNHHFNEEHKMCQPERSMHVVLRYGFARCRGRDRSHPNFYLPQMFAGPAGTCPTINLMGWTFLPSRDWNWAKKRKGKGKCQNKINLGFFIRLLDNSVPNDKAKRLRLRGAAGGYRIPEYPGVLFAC